jgi:hypothetical protein
MSWARHAVFPTILAATIIIGCTSDPTSPVRDLLVAFADDCPQCRTLTQTEHDAIEDAIMELDPVDQECEDLISLLEDWLNEGRIKTDTTYTGYWGEAWYRRSTGEWVEISIWSSTFNYPEQLSLTLGHEGGHPSLDTHDDERAEGLSEKCQPPN